MMTSNTDTNTEWETVIGLEVHVQLLTHSKIFSGCSTRFGAEPNTQACALDLGLPGTLPVLNKEAVDMAIKFGLSTDSAISPVSIFSRKNYFYPDLPKGYQISQFDKPTIGKGHLDIEFKDNNNQLIQKRIGITRAHLEEDAGKSLHESFHQLSGIDLNRAGTPLLEIVSEPDMRSAKEAVAYLKKLHALVCYLGICDGNMQEGSFRCDANVSVRKKGSSTLGTRTETKNVNSFKFVEQAIHYEVGRQIELIESGGTVRQQTRLFDPVKQETRPMRDKEEANDYRYFPDPDLLPVMISQEHIDRIKASMPELPNAKCDRFTTQYALTAYDAQTLTAEKSIADYFEQALTFMTKPDAKLMANWVMGELSAILNKENLSIQDSVISPKAFAALLNRIVDNTISGKIAKVVFEHMWASKGALSADEIIEKQGLKQVTDNSAIEKIVDTVIANNLDQFKELQSGKDKLFGFFVGQVMKLSKGQANPQQVNDIIMAKIKQS
jgi:aspartyl-tRNA(Asn)/glutamyl-tRNA(Gln) amidotransferase subunit B